jgi:hypothetical protein
MLEEVKQFAPSASWGRSGLAKAKAFKYGITGSIGRLWMLAVVG